MNELNNYTIHGCNAANMVIILVVENKKIFFTSNRRYHKHQQANFCFNIKHFNHKIYINQKGKIGQIRTDFHSSTEHANFHCEWRTKPRIFENNLMLHLSEEHREDWPKGQGRKWK